MEKSITPNQIKQNNRSLIYHYIYKNRSVSQQDISYDLHLSRPTVTSNLASMEKEGLITKSGHISTEFVGRKASAYSIIADYRVSIGVEIVKKEVKIIAVDLYGKKIGRTTCDITYEYKESYFKTVCDKILEFKNASGITDEQLLGIGCCMAGYWTAQGFPSGSLPGIFPIPVHLSTMRTARLSLKSGYHRDLQMPSMSL